MNTESSPALPHYAKGTDHYQSGDYDAALASFQKAAEADPGFYRAHAYLGMTYDKMKRTDEAIEAYRKCIEIGPDYHKAYNNVGELYRRKGLLDYASQVFEMATELCPDNATYFYNLGLTCQDIGLKKKAGEALTRSFDLEPDNYETASDLAQFHFTQGHFEGALKTLEKFLETCPDHDQAPEIQARVTLLKKKVSGS